jgi:hypothetical protein
MHDLEMKERRGHLSKQLWEVLDWWMCMQKQIWQGVCPSVIISDWLRGITDDCNFLLLISLHFIYNI